MYNYRTKLINPDKRSDFVILEMHNHHRRFASVEDLRSAITEEFCENVPTCNTSTCTFQVGYFQSSKH